MYDFLTNIFNICQKKSINLRWKTRFDLTEDLDKYWYTCLIKYFEDNKDTLIPATLPTAISSEFMVMEKEVWNIAKRDLLVLKYYTSFADFKSKISTCFRAKDLILI